ncbi:hypothetical protein GGER_04520 [Serratia rubidaea]
MHKPLRYTLLATSLLCPLGALAQSAGKLPLMPWPQQVEIAQPQGKLVLTPRISLQVEGDNLGTRRRAGVSVLNCRPAGRWRRGRRSRPARLR